VVAVVGRQGRQVCVSKSRWAGGNVPVVMQECSSVRGAAGSGGAVGGSVQWHVLQAECRQAGARNSNQACVCNRASKW